ncbi:MAG TPA: hypothetical protein VN902_23450 [Candidatus Acidoferrales bacterium]|jgi:hypothetical protein|nr:hypothetical protein [Candidatus Acidoferrales bacterium]
MRSSCLLHATIQGLKSPSEDKKHDKNQRFIRIAVDYFQQATAALNFVSLAID